MKRFFESEALDLNDSSGFTLVELLVVLALLALMMAIMTPLPKSSRSSVEAKVVAQSMVTALRRAQAAAMTRNLDEVFSLDLGHRTYGFGKNPPVIIPDTLDISLYTAREELVDDTAGQIRFFADGSATGGRIRLSGEGQQQDIHINWLTGRVWIHQP